MNYTQVIEAKVCNIFPVNEDNTLMEQKISSVKLFKKKKVRMHRNSADINKKINYFPVTMDNWYLADVNLYFLNKLKFVNYVHFYSILYFKFYR